jgi:hypothetical protein
VKTAREAESHTRLFRDHIFTPFIFLLFRGKK